MAVRYWDIISGHAATIACTDVGFAGKGIKQVGKCFKVCLLTLVRVLKERWAGGLYPYSSSCLKREVGAGGGEACLLTLTRVSYVF